MTGMEMVGGTAVVVAMLIAIFCALFYWSLPVLAAASSVSRAHPGFIVRIASASLIPMILHTLVSGGLLLFAQYKPLHFDTYRNAYVTTALLVAALACIWSHRRALRPLK